MVNVLGYTVGGNLNRIGSMAMRSTAPSACSTQGRAWCQKAIDFRSMTETRRAIHTLKSSTGFRMHLDRCP